ncbi:MAG TPA: M67 family metallopeptidase [Candidatus Limnocylindrales bacterium]|nr:M67 family metallopeptidase [Candidatus Limnocylindrales bacterium]
MVKDRENVPEGLPPFDAWQDAAREGQDAREVVSESETAAGQTSGEVSIAAELLQAVIDAAREGVPNEACGLLVAPAYASEGGTPTRYVGVRNAAESPYRYMIDPQDQLKVWMELEDAGEVPWAIVHSHVASLAVPSATDIGLAFFPDSLYVICSLAGDVPTVRAWSIREQVVSEVTLAVI